MKKDIYKDYISKICPLNLYLLIDKKEEEISILDLDMIIVATLNY